MNSCGRDKDSGQHTTARNKQGQTTAGNKSRQQTAVISIMAGGGWQRNNGGQGVAHQEWAEDINDQH
jgi:hypothetical protein